jgi:hypothetical protein
LVPTVFIESIVLIFELIAPFIIGSWFFDFFNRYILDKKEPLKVKEPIWRFDFHVSFQSKVFIIFLAISIIRLIRPIFENFRVNLLIDFYFPLGWYNLYDTIIFTVAFFLILKRKSSGWIIAGIPFYLDFINFWYDKTKIFYEGFDLRFLIFSDLLSIFLLAYIMYNFYLYGKKDLKKRWVDYVIGVLFIPLAVIHIYSPSANLETKVGSDYYILDSIIPLFSNHATLFLYIIIPLVIWEGISYYLKRKNSSAKT